MLRLVILMTAISLREVLGASHPELWGQQPDQDDIDNGQCVPIKCSLGVPPSECTRLCSLRHYIPICQPPADFCLCQRLVGNSVELVSPDEVLDQPVVETHSFILAAIVPLHNLVSKSIFPPPSPEPYILVNVNEGRLLWDFHYILTGLFLLMVGLVLYELIVCRMQTQSRSELSDHKGVVLSV